MGEARASPESTGVRLFCRSDVARTVGFSQLMQRDNPGRLRHDDDRSSEQLTKMHFDIMSRPQGSPHKHSAECVPESCESEVGVGTKCTAF